MKPAGSYMLQWIVLACLTVIAIVLSLMLGSTSVYAGDVIRWLIGQNTDTSVSLILGELRLPRTVAAIVAGAGLGIAGLLMQTLFRNPIAGPYVLGISSGASLGVAVFLMAGVALGIGWMGSWGLIVAASAGALLIMFVMLMIAGSVQDITVLLIAGLMLGMAVGSVVSILQYFSGLEELRHYVLWTFGSLSGVGAGDMGFLLIGLFILLIPSFLMSGSLNTLLLGERYAITMGVNVKVLRYQIILITALLTGLITAYCGPIAFVGIAVPHMARMMFMSNNHKVLIPACILCGSIIMLGCDIIARGTFWGVALPVNAITSLAGAPLVIWLAVKSYKFM